MQYTQLSRRSAGGKIDWEKQYLTFIPVEDAVFSWEQRADSGHLEYSINGGQTWVTIADGENTPTITAGSKVIWRGDLRPTYSSSDVTIAGIGIFSATNYYKAYGNTMSLLFNDNFYGSQLEGDEFRCAFLRLFYNDDYILTAPELPATTLATHCYYQMFYNCGNLITTQKILPATTLSSYCYIQMYYGCTSLTTAPELPATRLTAYSYNMMFRGCTNLSFVKCLATDVSARSCKDNWLRTVSSQGTFVKAVGMEGWAIGPSGIPNNWTVVDDNS